MIGAARGFLLAVLAASVVATLVMFLRAWAFEGDFEPTFDSATAGTALLIFLYCAVIATAAMVLVCLPLTMILSSLAKERAWTYPAFGCLTGIIAAAVIFTPAWSNPDDFSLGLIATQVAYGGGAGLSAGLVWWLGYRKARAAAYMGEEFA